MSFNYYASIPNPPNDPADDVFLMQTNSSSIYNALEVDHVTFNNNACGQHNQVTFNINQSPPPLINGAKGEIYCDERGTPALAWPFWYNSLGAAYQLAGPTTNSANGTALIPGGITIKWGLQALTNSSSQEGTVTFPAGAFNNTPYVVLVSLISKVGGTDSSDNTIAVRQGSITASQFMYDFNGNGGSYTFFNWISIGP